MPIKLITTARKPFKKPLCQLIGASSVLAASLVLSACNEKSATPATSDNKITATETANDAPLNANAATDPAGSDDIPSSSLNAEEEMTDTLANYYWTLMAATDATSQPINELMAIKEQVTLSFGQYQGQNMVSYSVGCNTISAVYQLAGQLLETQNGMSTQMACGELNIAENQLNKLMQGSSTLTLSTKSPPTLTQTTSDAATLVWRGKMTAQAKYNSKGETVFWAIDAKSKPCTNDHAQRCLQVTPITYDDQGIKINEGEKVEFAGTIDGYERDGKHDQVLRLQRYELADSETEYAYVLDMVIESKVVE